MTYGIALKLLPNQQIRISKSFVNWIQLQYLHNNPGYNILLPFRIICDGCVHAYVYVQHYVPKINFRNCIKVYVIFSDVNSMQTLRGRIKKKNYWPPPWTGTCYTNSANKNPFRMNDDINSRTSLLKVNKLMTVFYTAKQQVYRVEKQKTFIYGNIIYWLPFMTLAHVQTFTKITLQFWNSSQSIQYIFR